MVTFLFLVNYIAALFVSHGLRQDAEKQALQIFHGDIPADADNVSFSQQLNAFYGMYQVRLFVSWSVLSFQVFSSEDWVRDWCSRNTDIYRRPCFTSLSVQ